MSEPTLAERFAEWAAALDPDSIPATVRDTLARTVLDAAGLMVAAGRRDYVRAVRAASDGTGPCTVIAQLGSYDPAAAALIAGTAVHGEDFDDTFEGTPVHVGAVMVPALFAAGQARGLDGGRLLPGLAAGGELICRLALVAPAALHRQGFHPTAICGAFGAAAGISVALGLDAPRIATALGIAGSLASGIIEYLAEGTSTKRLHPGWAAQAGWRAARLAEAGFSGPRTVFEGKHGVFHAFAAPGIRRNFAHLAGWGEYWHLADLAFKPHACGTMAQPFVDCALALRADLPDLDAIERITARVGEGTVHRLWEPRAEKVRPSTPYSAKFSVPYCVAVALLDGAAGLEQFTPMRLADPSLNALAEKVVYEIDPANDYPENYSGHLTVRLEDGHGLVASQPSLRGGRRQPLSEAEIDAKFFANAAHGGWPRARAEALADLCRRLFGLADLDALRQFAD